MRTKIASYAVIICIFLFSCQKEIQFNQRTVEQVKFAETPKEKQTVAVLKDVSEILKEVYKDKKAFYEVNSAIYSGYYFDERVLLKDLLFPEFSDLYKSKSFKSFNAEPGVFKKKFIETLNAGEYPALKEAMGINSKPSQRIGSSLPVDTAQQIYSNSNGVAIYFPYSENFGTSLTVDYFDNINTDPWGNLATIVSADREANSGPGSQAQRRKITVDYDIVWVIQYFPVTVDDNYAETHITHILDIGAEPTASGSDDPPTQVGISRVFHGWSRLTEQKDNLISFTGNGGGSEIKVARISGYLQFQNQQVTNFSGDQISIRYKRKEIRKSRWKRVYGVWDGDWNTNNLEQIYATWEDDTQGTKTFTGTLGTTVKMDSGNTTTGNISYKIEVQTQDELITQRKITRVAYFTAAKADQGWGYSMCDDLGCRYDNTFLSSGLYWPMYDNGTIWGYTWPYNNY